MRDLYARFVLWLIWPALERHDAQTAESRRLEAVEAIHRSVARGGLVYRAIKSVCDCDRRDK